MNTTTTIGKLAGKTGIAVRFEDGTERIYSVIRREKKGDRVLSCVRMDGTGTERIESSTAVTVLP